MEMSYGNAVESRITSMKKSQDQPPTHEHPPRRRHRRAPLVTNDIDAATIERFLYNGKNPTREMLEADEAWSDDDSV